jgi:hypothetical protein
MFIHNTHDRDAEAQPKTPENNKQTKNNFFILIPPLTGTRPIRIPEIKPMSSAD